MPSLFDMLPDGDRKDALISMSKPAPKTTDKTSSKKSFDGPRAFKPIPDFVAIDLETTGLSDRDDRITEIAAVRFIDGRECESYSTFVNPKRKIPAKITELTGITDEMVKDAPAFSDVMTKLLDFIGDLPLCGHQVDFDVDFLNAELKRANRPPVKNTQLDTAALSRMLIDGLAAYSLGSVAAHLNVALVNAHRALDDARASGFVAVELVPRINSIPPHVRRRMGQFAPYSFLKVLLIRGIPDSVIPIENTPPLISPVPIKTGMPEEPLPLARDAVELFFAANGPLAQKLSGYSPRKAQQALAVACGNAISGAEIIVAEAGTGTGKSLAYLMPAAAWAVRNDARIFVSTATRNLQDQLAGKDLPLVSDIVPGLRFCMLKGRSNYICVAKWRRFIAGEFGSLSMRERLGILPLIRWAEQTRTGDIEELGQFNRTWYARIWGLVNADGHSCRGRSCQLYDNCFLQQARMRAQCSHVVVINHSLFYAEVCAESGFLGKPAAIIFDEAHQLEQSGYRSLRTEVDSNRLTRTADQLALLEKPLELSDVIDKREERLGDFRKLLKRLRRSADQFEEETKAWANSENAKSTTTLGEDDQDFCIPCINKPFASSSGRAGLMVALSDAKDFLREIRMDFESKDKQKDHLCSDAQTVELRISQLRADLEYVGDASTEDHVFWVEGSFRKGWIKLCGVPLDLSTMLSQIWENHEGGMIFTSATIRAGESDSYFRTRLGLDALTKPVSFAAYPSPFIEDQVIRFGLAAGPLPDDPAFPTFVADAIAKLLFRTERNILVLFTANAMMMQVHELLRAHSGLPEGASIFAQNFSGNRNVLLSKFKSTRKAVLLGLHSFWEGVDAPGESCEIVVIPRLPFPVPTHPLAAALAERAEKSERGGFFGYSIPEAVIRFRQGAGRLIRTIDDNGALVVLDTRMMNKGYGKQFISAVGEFTKIDTLEEFAARVGDFFGAMPKPLD